MRKRAGSSPAIRTNLMGMWRNWIAALRLDRSPARGRGSSPFMPTIWRCSLVVEPEPLKLTTGVRFPVAPPISMSGAIGRHRGLKILFVWVRIP